MREGERQRLGFTFEETMGGYIADGEGSYRQSAAIGRRAGNRLRFRVRITIDDLRQFIADPAHEARLTGTVEGTRFNGTFPIDTGTFNLFIEDERGRKQMRYRMSFVAADGQRYRLEGFKDVHNDRVIDCWGDTTTLFTTVRREDGAGEQVVATGILWIRPHELAPQVASMRGLNARTIGGQARALLSFGKFFGGRLWDEYGLSGRRENKAFGQAREASGVTAEEG